VAVVQDEQVHHTGGAYVIKSHAIYYCGTWRNRGATICANSHTLSRKRAERAIVAAVRDRLYTPENLAGVTVQVRALLQERARQYAQEQTRPRTEDRRRVLDAEISNIEQAVVTGKATTHLLAMLDARTKERDLLTGEAAQAPDIEALQTRLAVTLARLPDLVAQAVDDLHALLTVQQIERGREVLSALLSEVRLYPQVENGKRQLEAELRGNLSAALTLASGANTPLRWLGIIRDLRTALKNNPLPTDVLDSLLRDPA
jgi:hypothetical protein